jgi:N-acetyl-gamma-glutamyl-phosphate reductase
VAHRVGIVGASGYGGAELARLLAGHPGMDLAVVAARSQADRPVADLFPNLAGTRTFDAIDVDVLADLDLVFLATPHGPAIDLGGALHERGTRVVDLSAAFRLTADGFATWYGETHPRPDLAPATYGLTEFARDDVAAATLVANPGCYPTATLLGLLPVAHLIDPATIVIDAKSGTSGAGRAAKDHLHFAHVHGALSAYGAPTHRHTGEIETWLGRLGGLEATVSFTPHLVPMVRGLLATTYATLREGVTADEVQTALHDR